MKNIFENAYFGKAYKTSDGRKVLLVSIFPDTGNAFLISEYKIRDNCFGNHPYVYRLDGINKDCPELDIVSEWGEISEEELDKLAEEYFDSLDRDRGPKYHFKAGCRKMRELK